MLKGNKHKEKKNVHTLLWVDESTSNRQPAGVPSMMTPTVSTGSN